MTMHRTFVLAASLGLACTLGACGRDASAPADPPDAPAPDAPASGPAPQTVIGKAAQSAIDKARQQLATESLHLGGNNGININGTRLGGGDHLPPAEITPVGDFSVDGQPVTLDAQQRERVMAYREQMLGVIGAGMDIGIQGADLAGKALKEVFDGLLAGNPDQVKEKVQAESDAIEASARQLCLRLPSLLAAQDSLAASVPAFTPYATLTQADIDRCGESASRAVTDASAATAGVPDAVRDAIQETARAVANATASVPPPDTSASPSQPPATATSSSNGAASNVVTVNRVRFLLPPGGSSVSTDPQHTLISHPQGLRIEMRDDALLIDGRSYPRPAADSVVDLRRKNVVQIDEGASADP